MPKLGAYLSLPFKGDENAATVKRRLNSILNRCFPAAELKLLFSTNRIPTPPVKDQVSLYAKSKLIYHCQCTCGASYIGRTERRLSDRVDEHLPQWLIKAQVKTPRSSITRHILDTGHTIGRDSFRYINRQNNKQLLRYAEAACIWKFKPILCIQKEFVADLCLPW